MLKREFEITNLIEEQKLEVLALVETDTVNINCEKDYKIKGFKTKFPIKKSTIQKTRMIMLISEKNESIKTREDLMSNEFPSIWCEEKRESGKNLFFFFFFF